MRMSNSVSCRNVADSFNSKKKIDIYLFVSRDSSVDIATRYGLSGPWIESRRKQNFPHTSRPAMGPTQPPIQWVLGLFPNDKAAEVWR